MLLGNHAAPRLALLLPVAANRKDEKACHEAAAERQRFIQLDGFFVDRDAIFVLVDVELEAEKGRHEGNAHEHGQVLHADTMAAKGMQHGIPLQVIGTRPAALQCGSGRDDPLDHAWSSHDRVTDTGQRAGAPAAADASAASRSLSRK